MKNLENKRWYRFLKVIYIFSAIFLVLWAFAGAWTAKPESVVDYAEITCKNGYSVNSNDVDIIFDSEYVWLSEDEDSKLKVLCSGEQGTSTLKFRNKITGEVKEILKSELTQSQIDKIEKNYSLEFIYKTEGSWTNFLLTFVSISFFGFLFIEVIRRTLLYIVAGKSFFSKNF